MQVQDKNSWIGEENELLHTLRIFGAEQDAEGLFLIWGSPVIKGLDGSIVVHGSCLCKINGQPVPVTSLLSQTSYGSKVTVIGV